MNFFAALKSSVWAYPALEVAHICGIALLLGNLVLLEMRVFGRGLWPLDCLCLKEFVMNRRAVLKSSATLGFASICLPVWAHHGWSSFDQDRPIYLEGKVVKSLWQNPHTELEIDLPADMKVPADLTRRTLPAQTAPVDGKVLLAKAALLSQCWALH